jgi:hypothetical protein
VIFLTPGMGLLLWTTASSLNIFITSISLYHTSLIPG